MHLVIICWETEKKKKKTFLNLFDNISKPEADEGFVIRFG